MQQRRQEGTLEDLHLTLTKDTLRLNTRYLLSSTAKSLFSVINFANFLNLLLTWGGEKRKKVLGCFKTDDRLKGPVLKRPETI